MQPTTDDFLDDMQHLAHEIRAYQVGAIRAHKGPVSDTHQSVDDRAARLLTEFLHAALELQVSDATPSPRTNDKAVTLSRGLTSIVGLSREVQTLVQKAFNLQTQNMPQA